MNLGYQQSEKGLGHVQLQAYSVSACLFGLWHNFQAVWDWKRCNPEEIQSKQCFATGSRCFDSTSSTPGEIESAGEKAIVAIYNGEKDDTLNGL